MDLSLEHPDAFVLAVPMRGVIRARHVVPPEGVKALAVEASFAFVLSDSLGAPDDTK
jgi:hypothetical protein